MSASNKKGLEFCDNVVESQLSRMDADEQELQDAMNKVLYPWHRVDKSDLSSSSS